MSFESQYGDFPLVIVFNSNLASIFHRLAAVHPWQTDRRQPCHRRLQHSCSASKIKRRREAIITGTQ